MGSPFAWTRTQEGGRLIQGTHSNTRFERANVLNSNLRKCFSCGCDESTFFELQFGGIKTRRSFRLRRELANLGLILLLAFQSSLSCFLGNIGFKFGRQDQLEGRPAVISSCFERPPRLARREGFLSCGNTDGLQEQGCSVLDLIGVYPMF